MKLEDLKVYSKYRYMYGERYLVEIIFISDKSVVYRHKDTYFECK